MGPLYHPHLASEGRAMGTYLTDRPYLPMREGDSAVASPWLSLTLDTLQSNEPLWESCKVSPLCSTGCQLRGTAHKFMSSRPKSLK